MAIDAVSSTNRASAADLDALPDSPQDAKKSAPELSSTHAYDPKTAPVSSAPAAAPADFGQLLAGLFGGGKTSNEQANHFDFFALLGKIFESAFKASPPADETEPKAAGQTKSPAKDGRAAGNGGDGTLSSSDVHSLVGGVPTGPQDYDKGFKQGVHAQGSKTIAGMTMKGQADASVYAGAGTRSTVSLGPDGFTATAEADARIGVTASASGSITSDFGQISGSASVTAEIYAHAKGYVQANSKGITAGGSVEVGAHVQANAKADASALGGLVSGHAEATAEAGAGGKADAKVGVTVDPPGAVVKADADAFAGARASFDAKGGIAGMKYGVHGEAWAGVGAKLSVDAGITDGKFHFSFGAGISLGVGTFLKFDFEIDLKPIGKAFSDFFGGIASLFGGGKGDGSHANQAIDSAVTRTRPDPTKPPDPFAAKTKPEDEPPLVDDPSLDPAVA